MKTNMCLCICTCILLSKTKINKIKSEIFMKSFAIYILENNNNKYKIQRIKIKRFIWIEKNNANEIYLFPLCIEFELYKMLKGKIMQQKQKLKAKKNTK